MPRTNRVYIKLAENLKTKSQRDRPLLTKLDLKIANLHPKVDLSGEQLDKRTKEEDALVATEPNVVP